MVDAERVDTCTQIICNEGIALFNDAQLKLNNSQLVKWYNFFFFSRHTQPPFLLDCGKKIDTNIQF